MVNRNIRDKRNQLYDMSQNLQILALYESKYKRSKNLRETQHKVYKQWKFYDNYIKESEKQGRRKK